MNRKIVLIPYWIEQNLRRKGLSLSTVVDYKRLRAVTSLDDVVALVALQQFWGTLCGQSDVAPGDMVLTWFGQFQGTNDPANQELSHTVLPLSKDASVKGELQQRLFAGSQRCERYEEPFITYDLTPEFAGVVISPGFFGVHNEPSLSLRFVQAMLKVLYVYEPQHEVAKAPLFRRYLSLLSV